MESNLQGTPAPRTTSGRSDDQPGQLVVSTNDADYRLLVEGVIDHAIFMLDPNGFIVSWNAGAQRNKGYEAWEIIGKHFSIFYPEELKQAGWPDEELRLALHDKRFEDEGWRLRKDGSRFWASVVITPLYDARGEHRGFAKVTRDMTDKQRITVLEDEGRRITTFLAMLGHELRNPLAPISNAVSIIGMADIDSEPVRTAQAVIARQVQQLTRLVDDLMDVGRITSGKIHLESKPVYVRDAVAQAIETTESMLRAKSQVLKFDVVDSDSWVLGDKARIVQVIANLLTNAGKFTPENGSISIALRQGDGKIELSVKDSGIGIPKHMLKSIFDAFVQGDQDIARSQGGLGLGLSLVRQIVLRHGGQVAAYSTGQPGKGSEFVISLPSIAAPADSGIAIAPAKAGASRTVLIVDDNQDAAETMRVVLAAFGYRASVVHDGLAALQAIKQDRPDVVLLDIGLPGLSGLEVAERIGAELSRPPPLIAVTGYDQDSDREASFKAGFQAHVTKPVDVAELTRLLTRVLG